MGSSVYNSSWVIMKLFLLIALVIAICESRTINSRQSDEEVAITPEFAEELFAAVDEVLSSGSLSSEEAEALRIWKVNINRLLDFATYTGRTPTMLKEDLCTYLYYC